MSLRLHTPKASRITRITPILSKDTRGGCVRIYLLSVLSKKKLMSDFMLQNTWGSERDMLGNNNIMAKELFSKMSEIQLLIKCKNNDEYVQTFP